MEDKEFNYINVIPLVDIMLVLLTIVLTTATFVVQGEIPVNLPSAESGKSSKILKVINITITQKGRVYLNGKKVSIKELKVKLGNFRKDSPINLRADKSISLEHFVKVLDVLNTYGFKNVSLRVIKK